MSDLFGYARPLHPFIDIRNTRPSSAEEKARLVLQLGRLCNRVPAGIANGSVNVTRDWLRERKSAMKVCSNSRSSIRELESAIESMTRFA